MRHADGQARAKENADILFWLVTIEVYTILNENIKGDGEMNNGNNSEQKTVFKLKQAAAYLGLARNTARKLVLQGKIPGIRNSNRRSAHWYIPRAALDEYKATMNSQKGGSNE